MLSPVRAIILLWGISAAALAGVFAVAQLERSGSPIGVPIVDNLLSPSSNSELDSVAIVLNPPKPVRVTIRIIDEKKKSVAVLVRKRLLKARAQTFVWDGMRSNGSVAADGMYQVRITDHSSGRTLTVPTDIKLDTTPPVLGSPTLDVSRVDSLGVVRVSIPVRDAVELWLELDGERLVTNRIRPRRADIEDGTRTKVTISGRLPQGVTTKSLATGARDQLKFIAVDRAGNRSEEVVDTSKLSAAQ